MNFTFLPAVVEQRDLSLSLKAYVDIFCVLNFVWSAAVGQPLWLAL